MMSFKTARLLKDRQVIILKFPTKNHALVEKIASLPNAEVRFDQSWEVPVSARVISDIKKMGFEFSKSLLNWSEKDINKPVNPIHVPKPKNGLALYDYQKHGVQFIEHRNGRVLIADEMGLGKTVQALTWLDMNPSIRPALVVCPSSLKVNWEREVKKWVHHRARVMTLYGTTPEQLHGDIIIINYDILYKWVRTLQNYNFKCIVADECFPAGTKISTPTGLKNIESIKEGDIVFNAIGQGVVQKINKQISGSLIRLHLNTGRFIDVTPNHPFFTTMGWVKASDLKNKIILSKQNIFNIFAHSINLKIDEQDKTSMQMVWESLPVNSLQKTFLQHILLSEMEEHSSGNKKSGKLKRKIRKDKCCFEESPRKKSSMGGEPIGIDENKQPHFKSRNSGENKSHMENSGASISTTTIKRGKWKTVTTGAQDIMGGIRTRMESRASYRNKTGSKFRLPIKLQSGHSFSETQNMGRSGRMESRIGRSKIEGQEKRKAIEFVRVERVEVLEQTSGGRINDRTVYNLQISGHPSYYAEGFLVHNCHYIKTPNTQRTKAFKRLNKNVDKLIALSGTPIENKPVELYNIIQTVDPNLFPNYYSYLHRFCGAKRNFYGGLDTNGATNTTELNSILSSTIMIRRKKADVLKDLPPKQIVQVPISITNRDEYNRAEREFIEFLKQRYGTMVKEDLREELKQFAKRHKISTSDELSDSEIRQLKEIKYEKVSAAPALAKIESLKQLAAQGKMEEIKNWIETFLESDEKLVVFAIHKKIIDQLMKAFPSAVKIDGGSTPKQRQSAVDNFQNNPKTKLLIANVKAGGVGLTLTAASNVAIIQLPWSPSVLNQAIDRVHRITQVHQVTAWILIAEKTIEEKILALLKVKENIVSQVLDGVDMEDLSIFMELVNSYRKIKK